MTVDNTNVQINVFEPVADPVINPATPHPINAAYEELVDVNEAQDLEFKEIGYDSAPVCGSPQQEATNKIFRFVFNKPVFKYLTVESTFKAAFEVSTDGTTFGALAGADTVTIDGKVVIVTFNAALLGATNRLRIDANTLQDVFGNTNAVYTTSALTLT